MKRKAVTTGKSGNSKGMKNAAPTAPPSAPPQKIRLVQGGEPAPKTTKPGSGGTRSSTPPVAKKSDAAMPAAKKARR